MTTFSTMTNRHQNPDAIFDTINSKMCLSVYHVHAWVSGKKSTNLSKHYLKFLDDASYEAASDDEQVYLELKNAERVIDSKVNGRYAANPIRTIMLYTNDNQGGTKQNTPNILLCKLIVKVGNRFELEVNPQIVEHNEEAKQAIGELLASWQFSIQKAYQ